MSNRLNRRRFLQASAAASAGFWVSGSALAAADKEKSANDRLRIACVGVGGKGGGDSSQAGKVGDVVAICDVDDNTLAGKAKEFPKAQKFNDFRKMFDEMANQIDAVTVSTADHTHAPAAAAAIKLKKHVYVQKPLTHTVFEARTLRDLARQYGVCTQMGNQGSAANGLRRAVELVQEGVIGAVREAHVWTNRPVWPQAPKVMARPPEAPVPPYLHWEEWIGPAPMRPYAVYGDAVQARGRRGADGPPGAYHSFNWRGWWDFGTGALGDMACHTANMAFRALKLGHPTSIVAEATDVNPETYPSSAKITFQFPARESMPPVTFTWYEGQKDGKKLLPPDELVAKAVALDTNPRRNGRVFPSASILVGDKGMLYSPDDYGAEVFFSTGEKCNGSTKPEKMESNNRNDPGMKEEWAAAIKANKPSIAYSNFDFAAMLTETILLGNVAIRMNGQKLEWDGPGLKFTNNAGANQHLHYEYRKGWTL
jgi:predicted dehydrogenase